MLEILPKTSLNANGACLEALLRAGGRAEVEQQGGGEVPP